LKVLKGKKEGQEKKRSKILQFDILNFKTTTIEKLKTLFVRKCFSSNVFSVYSTTGKTGEAKLTAF
jgi:hypothetical protein